MKILLLALMLIFCLNQSYAAFPVAAFEKPVTKTDKPKPEESAEVDRLMKLSVKDYEQLTGKKMNFIERLIFKVEKRHMVRQLRKAEGRPPLNGWGFALGLLYGPFGLLAAYIFSKNENFKRSAFLGFKIWVGLLVIGVFVILAAAGGRFR